MNRRSKDRTLDSRTPHRVLFVPGLFQRRFRQSGRLVADLLAKRLTMPAISSAPDLLLDDGGRCACYIVSPVSDKCNWHPVEIVEVHYDDVIRERDRGRSLIHRAFVGILTLIVEMPRLRSLLLHDSKLPPLPRPTSRQMKWALKYAISYLAFTSISLFLLAQIIGGAWQHFSQAFDWASDLASTGVSGVEGQGQLVGWLAVSAVLATLVRTFVSKGLQETIEDDASSAFAFVDCQKSNSKLRRALLARLESAIAACSGDPRSSEISIVSYSEGALLAIDSLFPTDGVETARDLPNFRVRLFLTFGCPLAMVTRLWPNRRGDQVAQRATIKRWINVFETRDQLGGALFGSTKREGAESALVECGVATVLDDYEFRRRTSDGSWDSPHVAYWGEAERNDCKLLQQIVGTLTDVDTRRAR